MAVKPISLIVVCGPTASGKTALAVDLALALHGEVVSSDAMAVYRGMDIGTAKPTASERRGVPHHLLSFCGPEETCHVQRWLAAAEAAIADIAGRGRHAIVAGGSPLYVKALLEGLSAGPPRDPAVRRELEARYAEEGGEALLAELASVDPGYAAQRHPNDKRRIVRALEVHRLSGRPYSSFHTTDGVRRADYRSLLIGLDWEREILNRRINARVKAMVEAGLFDEVRGLAGRLGPEAGQAVGYKEILGHLRGAYDREHALYLIHRNTRRLAKQQVAWYRRFRDIRWLPGDAPDLRERACALAGPFLSTGGACGAVTG